MSETRSIIHARLPRVQGVCKLCLFTPADILLPRSIPVPRLPGTRQMEDDLSNQIASEDSAVAYTLANRTVIDILQ
ncbi:hypothetical protein K491DRAFT_333495 [Lophiostoma macrostomum CBS 122681]|uniref:Uncharacterized protein n=1 Tax=Lophiostoma macrostomum CBS 122681 TaxID=1314788 RepID=A0A6A6TSL0_9PLEO|nr:hypothetical protein K491DRAFT_333495 [Lophiostoma macrostomum CBS 122681]